MTWKGNRVNPQNTKSPETTKPTLNQGGASPRTTEQKCRMSKKMPLDSGQIQRFQPPVRRAIRRRAIPEPRAAAPTSRRCLPGSFQIDRSGRSGFALCKALELFVRQPGTPTDGSQQRPQRGPSFRQNRFPQNGAHFRLGVTAAQGSPAHAGRDAPRRAGCGRSTWPYAKSNHAFNACKYQYECTRTSVRSRLCRARQGGHVISCCLPPSILTGRQVSPHDRTSNHVHVEPSSDCPFSWRNAEFHQ